MTRTFLRAARTVAATLAVLLPGMAHADSFYPAWAQVFENPSTVSQFPHAVVLDARGNAFVTGHQIVGNAKGFYTAKYDALDGHIVWQRELNGAGTNEFIANDVAVDSAGDCIVTGSRNVGGDIDYYTVKYDGGNGDLLWQKTFDGANNGEDTALKVVCDGNRDVFVTGRSTGKNVNNSTGFDFVTLKYDADSGDELFKDSYTQTSGNLNDVPAALVVDGQNNIYVGGAVHTASNQLRFYLRKLSGTNLGKLWDIVPIPNGDESGVTAMAIDSQNNVVATGTFKDAGSHFGYYTVKYDRLGELVWQTNSPPVSSDTLGVPRPGPTGVAIGPDDAPMVTGKLLVNGDYVIRTVKYTPGGFFFGATSFWDTISQDTGLGFGDTSARAIVADGASNAIVIGATDNEDGDSTVYLAKYDALTGEKVFSTNFTGGFGSSAETGVDIDADRFGNVVALGDFVADKGTGIGLHEYGTLKFNRLIAPTGDDLPNGIPGVADDAKVKAVGIPAIGASGALAAQLSFKAGKKTLKALLAEGITGSSLLPVVQGQPAPVGAGDAPATWVSFSDPVVAPNGTYAFAAKVSGSGSKANGVWANLNGTLKLVFRQGSLLPIVGTTDKFSSLISLSISNNNVIALVKLSGPSATNMAVVRVDQNNVGTILLRKGQAITGTEYTAKTITIFSPASLQSGDGRWLGSTGIVARVAAVKTLDTKSKATLIVGVTNAGVPTVRFATGQDAATPVTDATYSQFGFPATAFGTLRFAVKATLTPRPKSTNSALIYSATGVNFNAFAEKGAVTDVTGLPAAVTYSDFTDPIVNTNSRVAFIATLKGSSADVKSSSNKAIVFGDPTGTLQKVARTGDFAADTAGDPSAFKWSSFTALALPGGSNAGPLFIGKLNTSKNNLGLWALDSTGKVRLLLRTGDLLGDRTVKKFTLLTVVTKSMAAARSFDSAGSVIVLLTLSDKSTALLRIGIP